MDTLRSPDELREMGEHLFPYTEIRRTETRKDVERLKVANCKNKLDSLKIEIKLRKLTLETV